MRRLSTLIISISMLMVSLRAQPVLQLETYATGLSNPVAIENAGDGRLFIVERLGYIRIVNPGGVLAPGYFLDIHNQIESGYQEQGLLGLAFHPDYTSNGYFYVYYTDESGNTVISRFSVSVDDPDVADPGSELVIYTASQPFVNHNGGCIHFGPDNYLYFGLGDGGSAGDPGNRAQNPLNKLGKMHRIDVDGGTPYAIPADNPFATAIDTLNEIWAIGYRNPWRWSFDALTHNMWVADVGQNLHEEIDVEDAGSGGHNYGWRCYEGLSEFNTALCGDAADYVFPIFDYPHNFTTGGFSITGGYVYRGTEFPGMYGYYLCADYVSGNWWWVNADGPLPYDHERVDDVQTDISSFGVDSAGEMYCANLANGSIYHITDACGAFAISTLVTDYSCGVTDGSIDLTINAGTAPYAIDWSTGETTEDIGGLAPGTYTVTVTDAAGCARSATAVVKDIPVFTVNISATGNVLSADAGVSWQWYLNGEIITEATGEVYTAMANGDYYVIATDANGCMATSDTINLIVNSVAQQTFEQYCTMFPNPVQDVLHVEYSGTLACNLQCFDATGRSISLPVPFQQMQSGTYILDVHAFQTGIYLFYFQTEAGDVAIRTLVVE
ncbi:MAG: PQQ-dependent sugar dehydrogenase [Chitinophagales bacterium]